MSASCSGPSGEVAQPWTSPPPTCASSIEAPPMSQTSPSASGPAEQHPLRRQPRLLRAGRDVQLQPGLAPRPGRRTPARPSPRAPPRSRPRSAPRAPSGRPAPRSGAAPPAPAASPPGSAARSRAGRRRARRAPSRCRSRPGCAPCRRRRPAAPSSSRRRSPRSGFSRALAASPSGNRPAGSLRARPCASPHVLPAPRAPGVAGRIARRLAHPAACGASIAAVHQPDDVARPGPAAARQRRVLHEEAVAAEQRLAGVPAGSCRPAAPPSSAPGRPCSPP